MNFKIVFKNSGDILHFCAIQPALLEYYVEQLNKNGVNEFHDQTHNAGKNIFQNISNLDYSIKEVNQWACDLLEKSFDEHQFDQYLNQYNLNKIHSDYVQLKRYATYDIDQKRKNAKKFANTVHEMFPDDIRFPSITAVLSKLGFENSVSEINNNIHKLESSFNRLVFSIKNTSWIQFKNSFSGTITDNNICNFRIGYQNVGRQLYDKYCNFDYNLEFTDENNFDEITNTVEISLTMPQTIPLSAEYLKWCHDRNKTPSGKYLNIGNIINLVEKLHDYRLIIFRNLLANNSFTIHLN
jgi:hypothetical protein